MPHATNPPGAPPSDSARLGWIDTARGLTMIFVVLLHADVVAQAMGRSSLVITLFNYALYPMRMPMFFLVAGLLSSALLTRSTGEVMRKRVLHYAWLYALWSTIYAVVHAWVLRDLGPPGMQAYYNNVEGPLDALIITWNNTWFLYALGLFYAAALAMRRLPVPLQVALTLAAALPGLFRLGLELGVPVLDRFYHFPYFMLGILGGAWLRNAIPRRLGRWQVLVALATICLVLAALAHQQRILREPAVIAALSVLAMPAELATALLLTRHLPRLARPLQVIGRNTLAVYVLHTITLRVLLALTPPLLPPLVLIPVLTLAAIALAILIGQPLQRHAPFLFALPGGSRRPRVQQAAAE